ncbi:hypothetical protein G8S55_11580 [Clostridium botulinum C]|uniref:hypothetical protein n=1 Tax=Clostridium botulinum TaxID=1491 RepID=UPI001E5B61D7|nr:hypothetical protein [Clostridium botulinum]MCD3217858.1 hypothetical protein [Clostridium botulinum C]
MIQDITLKNLEGILNDERFNEDKIYKLSKLNTKDGSTLLKMTIKESTEEYTYITKPDDENIESIILKLVGAIYTADINCRNSYIKGFQAFSKRKIKSLTLWLDKGNEQKVNGINKELVERYKLTEKFRDEVYFYKSFVGDLYQAKDIMLNKFKPSDLKSNGTIK